MKKSLLAALMVAVAVSPNLASAACEEPSALLSKAKAIQQPAERAVMLSDVIAACRDFDLANALGEAYAMSGRRDQAKDAFMDALDRAVNDEQRAVAFENLGIVARSKGNTGEAIRNFRASLKRKPSPDLEKRLLDLEKSVADTLVTTATIVAELDPTTVSKTKSFGKGFTVCPSIDIRIDYDFNSHRLKPEGMRQADEIAAAMKNGNFNSLAFKLVGHTDQIGGDQANDRLSLKRAESLKDYLVKTGNIKPERLSTEGKGKREPLFRNSRELARNRRVEIILVSPEGGDVCKP